MKIEKWIYAIIFAVIALLVVYPLSFLILGSFLNIDGDLTLIHWLAAAQTPLLWVALSNTVITSFAATCLALIIGVLLAIIVLRTDAPFRAGIKMVTIVPFITPPFVGALSWVLLADPQSGVLNLLLASVGIPCQFNIFSMTGMIWVLGLFTAPIVFFVCASGLTSIDPINEETARVCGSGRLRILVEVTLPLLLPSIASAGLLSFMTCNILFGVHSVIGISANIPILTITIYKVLGFIPINYYQAAILALVLFGLGGIAAAVDRWVVGSRPRLTVTGRGFRPVVLIALGPWKWVIGGLGLAYIVLVVILPYGVIFLRSIAPLAIWQARSLGEVVDSVSFSSYMYLLLENTVARRAITNSIFLGATAATAATLLGSIVVYFSVRRRMRGHEVLQFIAMAPLTVPGIVFGVALLWAYSHRPLLLYGTLTILFLAYATQELPIACRATYGILKGIHPELEESARVCGASWVVRIWEITLKLARPGLVVAWLLIFTSTLRAVGVSVILYSHKNEVIPSLMFNFWEEGLMQHVCTLAVLSVILFVLALWAVKRMIGEPFEGLGKEG